VACLSNDICLEEVQAYGLVNLTEMKRFLLFLVILSLSHLAFACDYCNCYVGLDPQYKRNNIGIRMHTSLFRGSHQTDEELLESGITSATFKELKTTYELHGQLLPTSRIQILFFMPYAMSSESVHGTVSETYNDSIVHGGHTHVESVTSSNEFTSKHLISGIGDPLLIAHYQVWNSMGADSTSLSHRFLAGVGLKFPFGNWRIEEDEEPQERLHEPGTGSWDVLISTLYLAQLGRTGFRLQANYLFAGTNKQSFRFGNKLNINTIFLRRIDMKKYTLYPNAGFYLESSERDCDEGENLDGTGGTIVFSHAGADIYLGRISLNMAFQLPVIQRLNETQPENTWRIIGGLAYSLN